MELDHTPEEFLGLVDLSIARYFVHPQYWRKDGALFFSIFNAPYFIDRLGVENVRLALAEARRRVRAAGLGEIHFNAQGVSPSDAQLAKSLGFDSLTDYNIPPDETDSSLTSYESLAKNSRERWAQFENGPLPYFPVVSTGWDRSPRCRLDATLPWPSQEYPYGSIVTNATAAAFGALLREAKAYAERPGNANVVYVNGWNEYTECPGLLPTARRDPSELLKA